MAKDVNEAFKIFMHNEVNLDNRVTQSAKASRDNLLANISEFDGAEDFFTLCADFNIEFGSFARKTKCRELDDIDLMIGISACGATYNSDDNWDNVHIMTSKTEALQMECARSDGTLNSTMVSNRFKKKLEKVREYTRSEVKRNGEAVVLNLTSKDWSFDIVPCFRTETESNGRAYYLIPNGAGNWKKTNPQIDRIHIEKVNGLRNYKLLELVRICKKWNKTKNVTTIPSYLLETIICNYAESTDQLSDWIDIRFYYALEYLAQHISKPVYDMKNIQGDINTLESIERLMIHRKVIDDIKKIKEAIQYEEVGDYRNAIRRWGEVFGKDFPKYTG